MSEPVSAMNGATYQGFIRVKAMGLQGMITLRGDLSSPKLIKAVKVATGLSVPAQRKIEMVDQAGVAWMSQDELLLLVPYDQVSARLVDLNSVLSGEHFLAVDVSDARAMFHLDGETLREVLAKLMPVDMQQGAFGVGDFRRTRMAQIPAAFWMPTTQSAQIICFRSVAEYAFNLLKDAAEPGSEVGFY